MGLKKRRKNALLQETNVNITPLMDVLTVLLFFLIKIFTVSSMNLTVPDDIKLPKATLKKAMEESVAIIVGKKSIRSQDTMLVRHNGKDFPKSEIAADGRSLKALLNFLQDQMDKRNRVFSDVADESLIPPGKILIHADKSINFKILKHILHTAAVAGYSDYQFLALKVN